MRKIDLTNFRLATSGTARQINRRIALSFIRRQAPLSRADLARSSGLQPSTVSAIIDELIEEGWVTEGAGQATRGRRPRLQEPVSSCPKTWRPRSLTFGDLAAGSFRRADIACPSAEAWAAPNTRLEQSTAPGYPLHATTC